eukprot:jgi/Psemu1/284721/fgenesh1_pg.62_\
MSPATTMTGAAIASASTSNHQPAASSTSTSMATAHCSPRLRLNNTRRSCHKQPQKQPQPQPQPVFLLWVLLAALAAVCLTICATTSDDVVRQVLRQEESKSKSTKQEKRKTAAAAAAVLRIEEESYGYRFFPDDSSQPGRVLSHAAFYEYKLPRAFLKVSRHSEELTPEQALALQVRAGLRQNPTQTANSNSNATTDGSKSNKNSNHLFPTRNIFLDEPYRDKDVDRWFKRSHRRLNTALTTGILSLVAMIGVVWRLLAVGKGAKTTTAAYHHHHHHHHHHDVEEHSPPGSSNSNKTLPSSYVVWLVPVLVAVLLVVSLAVAAGNALAALRILRRARTSDGSHFCPHITVCASSNEDHLEDETVARAPDFEFEFEFDACIEGCVHGHGGRLAVAAAILWGLCGVAIAALRVCATGRFARPDASAGASVDDDVDDEDATSLWWWWTTPQATEPSVT